MRKYNRFSVILAIGMILATLVSCKSNQHFSGEDPTKTVAYQDNNSKVEKAKDLRDELYPAIDMGGRTIRIATKGYPYVYYDSTHGSVEACERYEEWLNAHAVFDNLKRIETKYNVRIEYVPMKPMDTSEPYADIYDTDIPEALQAVAQGLVLPLKEYAPSFCDINTDKIFMKSINLYGDAYAFNDKHIRNGFYRICYNKDLLTSLGLEDPRSLYDKGEWDWDKFAEYAKLATKDLDDDGRLDQFGYLAMSPIYNLGFIYANNGMLASADKEELSSINVIEALQFLNKIYNEDKSGIYTHSTINPPNLETYKLWSNGKVLFNCTTENNGLFDVGYVPFPLGPHGDGTMYNAYTGNVYFIPKGVEKPDQVYQIFEELLNWYNYDLNLMYWWKSEGNLTEEENKEIKFILDINEKEVLDIGNLVFDFTPCYDAILSNEMSFDEAIDVYKDKLQEALDKVFMRDSNTLGNIFFE